MKCQELASNLDVVDESEQPVFFVGLVNVLVEALLLDGERRLQGQVLLLQVLVECEH